MVEKKEDIAAEKTEKDEIIDEVPIDAGGCCSSDDAVASTSQQRPGQYTLDNVNHFLLKCSLRVFFCKCIYMDTVHK